MYPISRPNRVFVLVMLLSFGFAGTVMGQVVGGSISGTVRDSSGAAVAGATVEIRNTETGSARVSTSDDAGRYAAPSVPIGTYSVSASK